jgi:hypothetical protein
MLENAAHVASIAGAVLVIVAAPIARLFSRVQTLEAKNEQLTKAIEQHSNLGERLARIEALLEVLIGERKPNAQ